MTQGDVALARMSQTGHNQNNGDGRVPASGVAGWSSEAARFAMPSRGDGGIFEKWSILNSSRRGTVKF